MVGIIMTMTKKRVAFADLAEFRQVRIRLDAAREEQIRQHMARVGDYARQAVERRRSMSDGLRLVFITNHQENSIIETDKLRSELLRWLDRVGTTKGN
jgi:hypothetical protein